MIVVCALLWLAAWAHVFAAGLTGLALLVRGLAAVPPRPGAVPTIAKVIAEKLVVGLPALWILLQLRGDPLMGAQPAWVWWPLPQRLLDAFLPGPAFRSVGILLCALGAAFHALRGGSRGDRTLVGIGLSLLLASLALPRDFLGWEMGFARLPPLAYATLIASWPLERLASRTLRVLQGALALWVAAGLWWAHADLARARAACEPALALLGDQSPDPRMISQLVLDLDCGLPPVSLNHTRLGSLPSLYAIGRRTIGEYAHATNNNIHLVLADPRRYQGLHHVDGARWMGFSRLSGGARSTAVVDFARDFRERPLLLLYSREADVRRFEGLGWRAEQRSPGLLLGHFEGCSAELHLRGLTGSCGVSAGAAGSDAPWEELDARSDGRDISTALHGLPCGPGWIHLGGVRCTNADWQATPTLVPGQVTRFECDAVADAPTGPNTRSGR